MEYNKIKINNYNVHFIKTNKFKENYINIRFTDETDEKKFNNYIFVSELLIESTKNYNKKQLLLKKQDLFDLNVSTYIKNMGKNIIFDFEFGFLNKKFSNKNIDKNVLDLVFEIIFNPNIIDNKFAEFEKIKNKINEKIFSENENKDYISSKECLKKLDNNNPISYSKNNVNLISNEEVVNYYKNLIKSNVDIFIVGNIDVEFYKSYLSNISFESNKSYKEFFYNYSNVVQTNDYIEIKNDLFKQASLYMGFKIEDLTDSERFYILPLYNLIIGRSASSKLFRNVREKHSLAYYCSSDIFLYNNICLIKSGIDFANSSKCIKLINKELNANITKSELKIAKSVFISDLNNVFNSFDDIVNYYYKSNIFNVTKDDILKNIEKVTVEDLNKIKNKIININTVVVYGN